MPNQRTLQPPSDTSWKRCPKTSCGDYGKRLQVDVGQDDYSGRGDLTVRHSCPGCGYAESGPRTPAAAKRTSSTLADLLRRQRLEGVTVPLIYTPEPFPEMDLS